MCCSLSCCHFTCVAGYKLSGLFNFLITQTSLGGRKDSIRKCKDSTLHCSWHGGCPVNRRDYQPLNPCCPGSCELLTVHVFMGTSVSFQHTVTFVLCKDPESMHDTKWSSGSSKRDRVTFSLVVNRSSLFPHFEKSYDGFSVQSFCPPILSHVFLEDRDGG